MSLAAVGPSWEDNAGTTIPFNDSSEAARHASGLEARGLEAKGLDAKKVQSRAQEDTKRRRDSNLALDPTKNGSA